MSEPDDRGPRSSIAPQGRGPVRAGRMPLGRPAAPARRPHRLLMRRTLVLVAGLLVLTVALGSGAYFYYDAKLTRVTIPGLGHVFGSTAPASAGVGENFLLVGSDTRGFVGGQVFQAAPGSADFVAGARSDTVILLHLPTGGGKPTLVSFPRDTYVQVPSFTDRRGQVSPAHPAKLNEAYSIGGPALLTQLIEQLTGLRLDHYVQVDFGGFRKIVDALGGLTVCVRTNRHDRDSGDNLSAGTHANVTGDQALAFVRDRKGLPGGDLDRIKDQQYFLGQVLHKVLSAGTLTDPARLNSFLSAVVTDVTVDQDFGLSQMTTLGSRLRHLDPAHATFATLPILSSSATRLVHGLHVDVVLLDPMRAAALFTGLRAPGTSTATPSTAPGSADTQPLTVPPSAITLEVRNATSTPGLAARTARALRRHGYTVTATGTAPRVDHTTVRYRSDELAAARTVAAALPGTQLVADPNLTVGVLLVLGPDAPPVTKVHLGSRPSPSQAAAALPAPAAPAAAPSPACAP